MRRRNGNSEGPSIALWLSLALLAISSLLASCSPEAFVGKCFADGDIDSSDRQSVDAAALAFANALNAGSTNVAWSKLAAETQASLREPGVIEAVGSRLKSLPSAGAPTIQSEIYFATNFVTTGNYEFSCPSYQEGPSDVFMLEGTRRQAHVLVDVPEENRVLGLAIWMKMEQGGWKVIAFHLSDLSLSGRDARQFILLAGEARAAGDSALSVILYDQGLRLMDRGPYWHNGDLNSSSGKRDEYAESLARQSEVTPTLLETAVVEPDGRGLAIYFDPDGGTRAETSFSTTLRGLERAMPAWHHFVSAVCLRHQGGADACSR